jgi:hypothetical protein
MEEDRIRLGAEDRNELDFGADNGVCRSDPDAASFVEGQLQTRYPLTIHPQRDIPIAQM